MMHGFLKFTKKILLQICFPSQIKLSLQLVNYVKYIYRVRDKFVFRSWSAKYPNIFTQVAPT
jgi:hypothetical protein